MPRGPRLDAPGVLHHVMARGIERCDIFRDDRDRDDFVERLARTVRRTGLEIHAWVLMPNHFHLLARTAVAPLEHAMRSLLTGHASYFNRRHGRAGHLFQNRYKSIVCDQSVYFLELVRYLHLNPLRGGLVRTLEELDAYPYSGHATLLGRLRRPWQTTDLVFQELTHLAAAAPIAYRRFIADGAARGRRPELSGGGLVQSARGWAFAPNLRRGREAFSRDERVLGGSEFVSALLAEVRNRGSRDRAHGLDAVVDAVCRTVGIAKHRVRGRERAPAVVRARRAIAYLWLERLGGRSRDLVEVLGASRFTVHRAAKAGRADEDRLRSILDELEIGACNKVTNVPPSGTVAEPIVPMATDPQKGADGSALSPRMHRLLRDLERIFLAEGFLHLGTDDLARRLRCSKRALYRLARSRDELLELVVERWLANLRRDGDAAAKAAPDCFAAVVDYLNVAVVATRSASQQFVRDLSRFPAGHRRLLRHQRRRIAGLERLIEAGTAEGAFRGVHPKLLAEVLLLAVARIVDPDVLASVGLTMSEAFAELYDILEHGLIPPNARKRRAGGARGSLHAARGAGLTTNAPVSSMRTT